MVPEASGDPLPKLVTLSVPGRQQILAGGSKRAPIRNDIGVFIRTKSQFSEPNYPPPGHKRKYQKLDILLCTKDTSNPDKKTQLPEPSLNRDGVCFYIRTKPQFCGNNSSTKKSFADNCIYFFVGKKTRNKG